MLFRRCEIRAFAVGAAVGGLSMLGLLANCMSAYPDIFVLNLLHDQGGLRDGYTLMNLIGNRPIIANVRMGGDCDANVCTRDRTGVIIMNVHTAQPLLGTGIKITKDKD